MTALAAFVLAAGSGTRLRPLTEMRPKALCPIDNVPLVDIAIGHASRVTTDVIVNTWHHSEQVIPHLEGRVRLSVESPKPLGTAGAIAAAKDWIDGRPLLVHNADAWHRASIESFVEGWDQERVRLLVTDDAARADFGNWRFCGVSLMPWSEVSRFEPRFSGLREQSWDRLYREGALDFVPYEGPYYDCGTPADYLAANLVASGAPNVVGAGAVIEGTIERCVVWPNARVERDEHLVEVIRAGPDVTVDASSNGDSDGDSSA